MVASGGGLSEGYGHGGPGVYLGDGQTEAEGVPSQGGCGDALLWRMSPYLTYLCVVNSTVISIMLTADFRETTVL